MKYKVRNRNENKIIYVESKKDVNILYDSFFGRIIIKIAISKWITKLIGKYYSSKRSTRKITSFIKENNINMLDYEEAKYNSFNDFFIRKIAPNKRNIIMDKNVFISPCDSKLTIYDITEDLCLNIKDSYYSINSLINESILDEYKNGKALVFRLDVTDYHRYCYIDDGHHDKKTYIKGVFHTVQPIALKKYNFYKTNSREYMILNTKNFDKIVQVEIGALGVGKITNHYDKHEFKKGEEKGYFEFGGSTIVLLIKKDVALFDEDILNNSKQGIETIVKYGSKIGKKY